MTIGERIKQARSAACMTQRRLSELSSYTTTTISRWECGRAIPSERALRALEDVLGVQLGGRLPREEEA